MRLYIESIVKWILEIKIHKIDIFKMCICICTINLSRKKNKMVWTCGSACLLYIKKCLIVRFIFKICIVYRYGKIWIGLLIMRIINKMTWSVKDVFFRLLSMARKMYAHALSSIRPFFTTFIRQSALSWPKLQIYFHLSTKHTFLLFMIIPLINLSLFIIILSVNSVKV